MKNRKTRKILLLIGLLTLLLLCGGYFGYPAYMSARETHLITQAQHHLAKADARKAVLCLQRVLRSNPRNVEACRLMAQLSEASRSPAALIWRSRVVKLSPHSVSDRLALAHCALLFRDYAAATNALAGVAVVDRTTAAYYNITGEIASTVGELTQAESNFLAAARLEPTNLVPKLNLAIVRLHGTNAVAMAEARTALTQIATVSPAWRCQALRELVADALRFQQTDVAVHLSGELVRQTNSGFNDRLLQLDVLRTGRNADFKPALANIEREAGTNSARIYELSLWQMTRGGPAETLNWLRGLPPNLRTNQPAALLIADCQTVLGDWRGLQNTVQSQNWAELEFTRHALLTRALRGQDLNAAAKAEWDLAMKAANGQKECMTMLLRMAAAWQWQSESEELLWAIFSQCPDEKWAFLALNQALLADGRTRSLMMLYSQELQRSPKDLEIKNNLAMTALLLDAQELRPHDLAREVYQRAPTNAACISTYAFSLHLQQKDREALKVIEQLPPETLQSAAVAGYYGLILQATGNTDRARGYLALAFKGGMLPEEKKLFERARSGA